MSESFLLPEHLQRIDHEIVEAIAAAERERSERPQILLVAVPPRHGKSTLISRFTPAWYLGTFPERRVMLASYEADFAAHWGMRARDLLEEHGPALFGVGVSRAIEKCADAGTSTAAAAEWSASASAAPITGRGAHLMIIDDPVKNAEQAMSEVIRERQWDWWQATARSRLEPGALVVVLMTRWHEADLGGRLIAASESGEGDPVREIRLPGAG